MYCGRRYDAGPGALHDVHVPFFFGSCALRSDARRCLVLQALDKYGKDLTQAAQDGKLDPVIGRDDEIRRTVQILSRRTKNNPILLGEPGGGIYCGRE